MEKVPASVCHALFLKRRLNKENEKGPHITEQRKKNNRIWSTEGFVLPLPGKKKHTQKRRARLRIAFPKGRRGGEVG